MASVWMVVAPLVFLYSYFIAWMVRHGGLPPATAFEWLVLSTMLARLGAVLFIPRLRRAKTSLIVDIFALDVLLVAILLLVYEATRVPAYLAAVTDLTQAWPAALLVVISPFAIYRLAVRMFEGGSLKVMLPGAVTLFVVLLVPAELASAQLPADGLSGVSRLILAMILGQIQPGSLVPEVTLCGLVLYLALSFYVVTVSGSSGGRLAPLVTAVVGSTTALGWLAVGSLVTTNLFLLFGAPGLAVLGVIWWKTREH
jgi:hypothetical protein